MNPGQYHRRPQMSCLPMNFQYTGSPVLAPQVNHRMLPFDGLPRTQPTEHFMSAWSSNTAPNNYSISNYMSVDQNSTEWSGPAHLSTNFDDPSPNDYYDYSTSISGNEGNGNILRSLDYADVPRTWPLQYDPRMLNDNNVASKTYNSSIYMLESNQNHSLSPSVMNSGLLYDTQDNSRDFARLSISRSPKMEDDAIDTTGRGPSFDNSTLFRVPSSEGSDDGGNSSREMTAIEADDHGVDEPYAKLIYRALMSAPNHSMVLQEIYQWFRANTTKGSSDTKGWMNSIRHNLSMNAAFKKTERKVPGDETKKSTEWVLEDFAVKDGVQSTTRYRKGTGSKKFTKSENSAPARQISGRKGGICASRTKLHRQRIKDDRSDSRRSIQKIETGRRLQFQHQSRPQTTQRQVSPLTPSSDPMPSSSPCFFSKAEQLDIPYEDMYSLDDVQGVYLDDSPLFSHGLDPRFHDANSMCASQRY